MKIMKRKKFTPPTLEQIKAYVEEKALDVDPEWFFNYFEAGNWHDSTGKPVKSWKQKLWTHHLMHKNGGARRKQRLFPIPSRICRVRGCGMPAVYKDSTGAYDHFLCAEHMPESVKAKYE